MSTEFQDPATSKPPDFGSAWAATASLEMLNAMLNRRVTEKYFGGVAPIPHYYKGFSIWTDCAATYMPAFDSSNSRDWYQIDFPSAHGSHLIGSPHIVDDKSVLPFASLTVSHHASTMRRDFANYAPASLRAQKSTSNLEAARQRSDPGAEPFVILERAKRLLSKQRIREARDILQVGAASYPDDEKIGQLVRAISPGRIQRNQGTTSSRKQEIDWILQHGHKYRGLWVAVSGDQLVASAVTLETLLVDAKRLKGESDTPVVQKIAPK